MYAEGFCVPLIGIPLQAEAYPKEADNIMRYYWKKWTHVSAQKALKVHTLNGGCNKLFRVPLQRKTALG